MSGFDMVVIPEASLEHFTLAQFNTVTRWLVRNRPDCEFWLDGDEGSIVARRKVVG